MAATLVGPKKVSFQQDAEGHRTYKVMWVVSTDLGEGPQVVSQCPGLPTSGAAYQLGSDSDPWAWFREDMTISSLPGEQEEAAQYWSVEGQYSTKPNDPSKQRCQDIPVEDPLLEPPKINGTSSKYQEEGIVDRFGAPIANSAHEQIRGPHNEWDSNRGQVVIEMNVANLNLPLLDAAIDHVNDSPLWGFNPRCIKLTTYSWERKFYQKCSVYFSWKLTFDVDKRTWDRDILDEGTKVLNGRWVGDQWQIVNFQPGNIEPNPTNPKHFIRFKDKNGEPTKVILNGSGAPAGVTTGTPTAIVATTVIPNGDHQYTIANQPTGGPNYAKLTIQVVDDNNSLSEGQVVIDGEDEHGNPVTDEIDISDAGTLTYQTKYRYSLVNSIKTQDVIGSDGVFDKINVQSDTSQSEAGQVHVEKYDEFNMLLLGIPLILG